jgi:predicted thioredoxin/glutaredoxin
MKLKAGFKNSEKNEIETKDEMISSVVLVDGEVKISGIVPPVDEIVSILKGE